MKPFYALLITANFLSFSLFSQQRVSKADSLRQLIAPALTNPDSINLKRINDLADEYFDSFPDSTLYYGALEIKLAKKINYPLGVADGTIQMAAVNIFRGDYSLSAKKYNAALATYLKFNNIHGISESYIGLGRIQDFLGNYSAAIGLIDRALKMRIKAGNQTDLADCYNIKGVTYDNKGDFSKALDCYYNALLINTRQKNKLLAADDYSNIGITMQEMGLYDKALSYFNFAVAIWKQEDDKQGISTAEENIGHVLLDLKKYKEASEHLNTAAIIYKKLDDEDGISLVEYDFGMYNYYTNHPEIAIHYFNLSLLSASHNKIKNTQAYAYEGLARVYNLKQDFKQAYFFATKSQLLAADLNGLKIKADATLQVSTALAGLKQFKTAYLQHELYTNLRDSLNENASINKLISYNVEVGFLNKKQQLAEEEHRKETAYLQKIALQKNITVAASAVIIIMAVLASVYYNAKRKQQRINLLLAQKNEEIVAHQDTLSQQSVKLNDLNLLKDRLIAVLAHDLRAPISTLRGLFNLLADDNLTRDEFISMVPSVFKQLENTSDFLDTLLFWINSEVDVNGESSRTSFKLADLTARELTHIENLLKQKNITVKTTIDEGLTVFANPNAIRIVIHNLLTNAIKFCNPNGLIQILAVAVENAQINFLVNDNGVGMSEDYLNALFKSRVASAAGTENETGTGMGLLFCKDLIDKNAGKIWVKSEVGIGTEVGFAIPMT